MRLPTGSSQFGTKEPRLLEAFDDSGIAELINRAPGLDGEVAAEVVRQGGGHPYILQYILYHLVKNDVQTVTLERVADELSRFRQEASKVLDGWWRDIGEAGRRVYHILAQSPNPMTQAEVTAETGLTRKQLYTISANNGFSFKTALKMDEIAETALVLRIRECMDKRMTRNKARLHLDISFSLLTRLIKNYEIPYPLAVC